METSLSRRDVLLAGVGAAGVLMALPVLQQAAVAADAKGPQKVGKVADFAEGTITPVLGGSVFVVHDKTGMWALSAICTHKGGRMNADGQKIVCPKHDSVFSTDGTPQEGPAKKPLPWLELAIKDGEVFVDAGKKVDAGTKTKVE